MCVLRPLRILAIGPDDQSASLQESVAYALFSAREETRVVARQIVTVSLQQMHLLPTPRAFSSSWPREISNNFLIHLILVSVTFSFLQGQVVDIIKRTVKTELRGILEESSQ